MKYTQLVNFQKDDYVSKVASTIEEAYELAEAGFEYVCDFEKAMKAVQETKATHTPRIQ